MCNDLHGPFVFSTKAGHDPLELVLICQLCIARRSPAYQIIDIGAMLATRYSNAILMSKKSTGKINIDRQNKRDQSRALVLNSFVAMAFVPMCFICIHFLEINF
jgi:hypothetical protein